MRLVKYLYPNLKTRADRDFFMRCNLSGMDVPADKVCRFDAKSTHDYSNQEEVCEAAIQDGFYWFESLKDSWMTQRQMAIQWTFCAILRELSQTLELNTCALVIQDDKLFRMRRQYFESYISLLDDLQILQIFQWELATEDKVVKKKLAEGSLKPLPPRELEFSDQSDIFYKGIHKPGDSAFVVSREGAKLFLTWIEEYVYDTPEIILYLESASSTPGLYSVVDPYWFIGHISGDIVMKD